MEKISTLAATTNEYQQWTTKSLHSAATTQGWGLTFITYQSHRDAYISCMQGYNPELMLATSLVALIIFLGVKLQL